MSLITAPLWLKEYGDTVEKELSKLYLDPPSFFPNETTELHRAAIEALSRGGKRVRAILALLFCEKYSGDYRKALPVALAYELAHASALIQDDIVDNSTFRRGERSTVAKYGLSNAILASDLLLFHVPKMISMYRDISSERLCELFDLVGESCRATTWGEFLDLQMASGHILSTYPNKKFNPSGEQLYEEMIKLKTASLLRAPAASGAIVGGASAEDVEVAYRFGEYVGMAYQIQDDLLDLMADEKTLGKPCFTDIRGGKRNMVLFHSLEHSSKEEGNFIRSLLGRSVDSVYEELEIEKARSIFERSGSVEYARVRAEQYVEKARQLLAREGQGSEIHESQSEDRRLLELSDYLSKRYC